MKNLYLHCMQCPRQCGSNRTIERGAVCSEKNDVRIAAACLHFGEEPPITAVHGSGTIFVSGCSLRCAFCQNYQISQNGAGRAVSTEQFADICLQLQDAGAENINIVTGSHAVPAIAAGLELAVKRALAIPVCWNSSAYESTDMLEMLDGLVQIWLPDLKTLNPLMAETLFKARNYPSAAKKALRWMFAHTEKKCIPLNPHQSSANCSGINNTREIPKEKMLSGIIVRHLVLPGRLDDTRLVLDWLKTHSENALRDGSDACISLMSQYAPVSFDRVQCKKAGYTDSQLAERDEALRSFQNRPLAADEYSEIKKMIASYKFSHLFYQEKTDDSPAPLPDFTSTQPFPAELARTVWHWKTASGG